MSMHIRKRTVTIAASLAAACLSGAYAQTISPGGIVNAAGLPAPVAPGAVISILGTGLATASAAASTFPLPATLGDVSVLVNGSLQVPLFYVSPSQINAQLPYETPAGPATLTLAGSAPVSFIVAPSAPCILVYSQNRAVAFN